MDLENLNPDSVEEIFSRHGATAITFNDAGDVPVLEPRPGEAPLWPETRICGLFPASVDVAGLEDDLRRSLGTETLPAHHVAELPDRVWEREWLRDALPLRFGRRLWVCPGTTNIEDSDAVVLRLDPGLAFGTGSHATTAMCLEWLDGLALDGKALLDYGCGSGILSIAALRLGCATATATDIDPQARVATTANAATNNVADRLVVVADTNLIDAKFDVVIANILAGPLIDLAATISGRVKSGCLLGLSGILSNQVDAVLGAYSPWIEFDEPARREQDGQQWVRLTGRRIGD